MADSARWKSSRGLDEGLRAFSSGVDWQKVTPLPAPATALPNSLESLHARDYWSESDVAFYLQCLEQGDVKQPAATTFSPGASSSRDHPRTLRGNPSTCIPKPVPTGSCARNHPIAGSGSAEHFALATCDANFSDGDRSLDENECDAYDDLWCATSRGHGLRPRSASARAVKFLPMSGTSPPEELQAANSGSNLEGSPGTGRRRVSPRVGGSGSPTPPGNQQLAQAAGLLRLATATPSTAPAAATDGGAPPGTTGDPPAAMSVQVSPANHSSSAADALAMREALRSMLDEATTRIASTVQASVQASVLSSIQASVAAALDERMPPASAATSVMGSRPATRPQSGDHDEPESPVATQQQPHQRTMLTPGFGAASLGSGPQAPAAPASAPPASVPTATAHPASAATASAPTVFTAPTMASGGTSTADALASALRASCTFTSARVTLCQSLHEPQARTGAAMCMPCLALWSRDVTCIRSGVASHLNGLLTPVDPREKVAYLAKLYRVFTSLALPKSVDFATWRAVVVANDALPTRPPSKALPSIRVTPPSSMPGVGATLLAPPSAACHPPTKGPTLPSVRANNPSGPPAGGDALSTPPCAVVCVPGPGGAPLINLMVSQQPLVTEEGVRRCLKEYLSTNAMAHLSLIHI